MKIRELLTRPREPGFSLNQLVFLFGSIAFGYTAGYTLSAGSVFGFWILITLGLLCIAMIIRIDLKR